MTNGDLPSQAWDFLEKAAQYVRDVTSGEEIACKWVKLAVERHVRDLEHGEKRGLVFDEYSAARALAIFPYLRHSKGEWQGKPVILEPWQCFIIACVFGWIYEETGYRRFSTIYEEIARKNGKTTKLGGIGIFGLTKDNEPGAEIYSAATKRDQAKLMFNEAKAMVNQSPALKKRIGIYTNNLHVSSTMSKFEPLSSDSSTQDGLNSHMSLIDEYHAHKTSEIRDVLISSSGARRQPLNWNITTAGFDKQAPCYRLREYCTKVLEGVFEDDSFFGIIYTIDDEDDWRDPRVWVKANPNLGISVYLDYLKKQAIQAEQMPSALNNFLTKHLNVWVNSETLWMNMTAWEECAVIYDLPDPADVEKAFGGLDLASTADICALAFVFLMKDGSIKLWVKCYLPEDTVKIRVERNQVPYDQWAREGWLTLTPGNVTDYNFIQHDIEHFLTVYDIEEIAFDRWNASQLVNNLTEEGAPMVSFGQGFVSMNPAMKEFERLILGREIQHNDNPVLNWAISNLVAQEDPAGNIKPAKNKSKEKIDPAVAVIMAIGRAMLKEKKENLDDFINDPLMI